MLKRFPFSGIPSGWYTVAFSTDLAKGEIQSCRYFGREFIVFRTESGQVRATDAYCPHLGAHLGDGRVDGENVRCSFHGFQFEGETGRCVKNAYGTKAPPKARLNTFRVQEKNGVVLVWYDARGRAPEWDVPTLDDVGDWTPLRGKRMDLRSHPQETSENSVDFGHFNEVHGFLDPKMEEPCVTEGPLLTAGYSASRSLDFLGLPERGVRAKFFVEVWGLGYSLVTGHVPALGLRFRHFVMSTPIDEEHLHLRLGSVVKKHGFGVSERLLQELVLGALWQEVSRDKPLWEKKIYVDRPVLAKGDGPIPAYRRYCQQFYPPVELPIAAE